MDPETVEGYCEEAAEQLIPAFEDRYGIEMDAPLFRADTDWDPIPRPVRWLPGLSMVRMGARPMGHAAVPLDEQRGGVVDIAWTGDVDEELFKTVTAHELGHTAIYQNAAPPLLQLDAAYRDDMVGILHEGVAERFQDYGTNELARQAREEGEDESAARYHTIRVFDDAMTSVLDATWRQFRPTDYSRGRDFFADRSDAYVAQAVNEPRSVYDELVERYD